MAATTSDGVDGRAWRVAIVEDHLLQRGHTEQLVESQDELGVVWSGETLDDFTRWLRATDIRSRPHLLILDVVVDRGRDADPAVVRSVLDQGIRVLVLSAMASIPLVQQMIQAGVNGVLGAHDSAEDVVAAMWTVIQRGRWIAPQLARIIASGCRRPALSDQEERALVLYASGLTLKSVAAALGVKHDTAKKYIERAKAKYAAVDRPIHTKVDMHRELTRDGLLHEPRPLYTVEG